MQEKDHIEKKEVEIQEVQTEEQSDRREEREIFPVEEEEVPPKSKRLKIRWEEKRDFKNRREEIREEGEERGFFASGAKTTTLIFLISLLIISMYPLILKTLERHYPQISYINSENYVSDNFETIWDAWTVGRLENQSQRGDASVILDIEQEGMQTETVLITSHNDENTVSYNGGKPRLMYYIADKEKKHIATNLEKDELNKLYDEKNKQVYARYLIYPDGRVEQIRMVGVDKYEKYMNQMHRRILAQLGPTRDEDFYIRNAANKYGFRYKEEDTQRFRSYQNEFEFDKEGNYIISKGEEYREAPDEKTREEAKRKISRLLKEAEELNKLMQGEQELVFYFTSENISLENPEFFYGYMEYNSMRSALLIALLALAGILLVFLIALLVPYKRQRKAGIVRVFNHMFLELKFLVPLGVGGLIVGGGVAMAESGLLLLPYQKLRVYSPVEDLIFRIMEGNNAHYFVFAALVAFFGLLFVYLCTTYFKYIYYMGFIEGVFKNSIFGRSISAVIGFVYRPLRTLLRLDLDKNFKMKWLLVVIGHCLFIFFSYLFSGGDAVSFLFAYVLYSAALFYFSTKFLQNLSYIQAYTGELAGGRFDLQAEEEVGVFSPMAKNLNSIKEGFKIAVEEETRSQNMKTELISNVSHDLKTPLTSIINYSDLLQKEGLGEKERQEYIDIIHKKSQRLKVLIEDLFEASKASSGNISIQKEELNIISLLQQTLGELEEKIEKSRLDFRPDLPKEPVICFIDGRRTYRIFSNIIGNITKYAMEGTRVYIDARAEAGEVRFIFKNISNYEMNFDAQEITERFRRGDESRNTEGSGLGLAIAKSLIELQGGRIEIEVDGDLFKLTATFPTL